MSDGSGKQQELTDEPLENGSETLQEWVIRLYNSPKFLENAVGFWLKVLYEVIVVAVGLLLFLLPALLLSYLDLIPFTYLHLLGLFASFILTIFGFTWCFSEPSTSKTSGSDEAS